MKVCECCGHPVEAAGLERFLTRMQRKLYKVVAASGGPGIDRDSLVERMYADDPDGGAVSLTIIPTMLFKMRPVLNRHGVDISVKRGPGAVYRLVKL